MPKFKVIAEFEVEAKSSMEALHKWDMRHYKRVISIERLKEVI